jgi:asparagine synthase (glutamine-hydrolysing)
VSLGVGPRVASLATRTSRGGKALEVLARRDPVGRLLTSSAHLGRDRATIVRGPLTDVEGTAERLMETRLGDVRADALASALYLDAQLGLPDDMLHYFDRASMAHSLEVRVPFLDHELVELCATIPSAFKLHRFRRTKHVLKIAARGLVPDEIIDKPKVGFFNRSVEDWLRQQTDGVVADYLLDPGARINDLVRPDGVRSLVQRQRHDDGTYVVLSLLMLEIWLSSYLPRAVSGLVPR